MVSFRRYARLLLAKLLRVRASSATAELMKQERPSQPRFFTQDEFEKNPSTVLRAADTDGSAVVTDAAGKPRMRIGATLQRPLVLD